MGKLLFKNMAFYGYHGVFAAEKEVGQRIEVDLELHGDFETAARADDVDLGINYVDVYTIVKDLVEEQEFNLLEGLGVAIADQILDVYDVEQVIVRVRNPHAPLGGLLDYIEAEVIRTR
ncbi:MAG: dihydroneopterin aldolase [Firmicutes bacterium]|nr:dihydroneopterin aldolase [Bacillota bacterium]